MRGRAVMEIYKALGCILLRKVYYQSKKPPLRTVFC